MHNKLNVLSQLKNLNNKLKQSDNKNAPLLEMENLIDEYLKDNPCDADMLIKLALTVDTPPLADYIKAIECLKKALKCEPDNVTALLVLAYTEFMNLGEMDEDVFQQLCAVQDLDPEIMSMVEYVKSWHYERNKNFGNYEKSLLKSIELWDKHANNYKYLGLYYIDSGNISEGKKLLRKALENITYVYPMKNSTREIYDVNEFLDEGIKGIHITQPNLETLHEYLEK